MERTVFNISKMDCPSEENLIRMKLEGISAIEHLDFDLGKRKLLVYHQGSVDIIEKALHELQLNSEKVSTDWVDYFDKQEDTEQRKLLWTVLIINFMLFIIEMLTGLMSKSMGLVADSLDMLADSFVYGLSLWVVGGTLLQKKRMAKFAAYTQMLLAILGFAEVLRRFIGPSDPPDYLPMVFMSILALIGNGFCLHLLQGSKSNEQTHLKASLIFTSNDVLINVGVLVAALLVHTYNSSLPDLIVGTLIFLLVLRGAWRIGQLSK